MKADSAVSGEPWTGDPWPADAPPYLYLRFERGDVVVEGQATARFGHQLDIGAGREPGGNWAEWSWDGTTLTIRSNRYRSYPLYVADIDDAIAVSPSIDRLLGLGIDRRLDLDAISVFLTIGHFAGEDTAFGAIRRLPAATTLTWQAGTTSMRSAPPRRPSESGTRAEVVATAAELTRAAVARAIVDDDDYIMPISGGRDSRHVLLELVHAGHGPRACVTSPYYAHLWGDDGPYAAALCRQLGIEHTLLPEGRYIPDEWRKDRLTSYCSDEHAWYLAIAEALRGRASHSYEGTQGATSLARSYYTPKLRRLSRDGRFEDLARQLGRRYRGQPRYVDLLAPAMRKELTGERAVARIVRELERHAHEGDAFLAFRFWGRGMGELVLPGPLMQSEMPRVYTPLLDPDLLEFCWSVPTEVADDALRDETIAHFFPDYARLPFRPKPTPSPSRSYMRRLNQDVYRMLRRHSDGALVDRGSLVRRTAIGAVTGSDWISWGRRSALTAWLVQLEAIISGRGPSELA